MAQQSKSDSKARFIVGTVVHSLSFFVFLVGMVFGILAIVTYLQGKAATEPFEGLGAGLGAVICFLVFLISGGIHQILGYAGIPILFPCRRAESGGRRTAARVLLILQAISLALDFVMLASILLSFRA